MMPPPVTHPCGTKAAYNRHHRRGEQPCEPCRQANAAWFRDHRKRKPVTVAVYPAISPIARLLLGNELEWDGQPPYGVRRDYLDSL